MASSKPNLFITSNYQSLESKKNSICKYLISVDMVNDDRNLQVITGKKEWFF